MTPKLILNEAIPGDLRAALDQVAQAEDMTVNDAASRVLSKHFDIEWAPSGFSYRPSVAARFKLRVSEELHKELRVQAAMKLFTIRGLTLNILSKHFKTNVVSPQRRPRKEVVDEPA